MDISYSGSLEYKDFNFTFTFDGKLLKLIPNINDFHDVYYKIIMNEVSNGSYAYSGPPIIDINLLEGKILENSNKIVFYLRKGSFWGYKNSVLLTYVTDFLIIKKEFIEYNSLVFESKFIDYIHPITDAYDLESDNINKGEVTLKTKPFSVNTTSKQDFKYNKLKIQSHFSTSRTIKTISYDKPIIIRSSLVFEFDKQNDYILIKDLYRVARKYIQFLTYNLSVNFDKVKLRVKNDKNTYIPIAEFYSLEEEKFDNNKLLEKGRYIKQSLIDGYEGLLLNLISKNQLYNRHIPESYKARFTYDVARFIMITSAFEWEFSQLFADKQIIKKNKYEKKLKVKKELDKQVETKKGEEKSIYKFFSKNVLNTSLEEKLNFTFRELNIILEDFGNMLYNNNDSNYNYKNTARNLTKYRNAFAHGNLDKDFLEMALTDIIFLEYVIYTIQLKRFNLPDENIRDILQCLFGQRLI